MKRFIAGALVLLLLVCLTSALASTPGTASDPLLTLSYLNNTFFPSLVGEVTTAFTGALGKVRDDAAQKLDAAYDGYMLRLGGQEGYSFAGSFSPFSLPAGRQAELLTGSTFILTSGSARVQIVKGVVINLSRGTQVASQSALALNERYFCAEDTAASFVAASDARCLIDGYYKTGGTAVIPSNRFIDVSSADWFYDAVNYVSERGLFTGTTETTFSPKISMTRAMFVTVLHRLAGKPGVSSGAAFSDVGSASLYYYDAVSWANATGIVTGYDDGTFRPDVSVTREQMAVIMHRYAAYAGYGSAPAGTAAYDAFPDRGSVSPYAVDAAKWAVSRGIINGSDGKLLPKNTATRDQVAQITLNFSRLVAGQ